MSRSVIRARLFLLTASVLVMLGGVIVAIGRWNAAETDRAFVEAAARAAALPASTALAPRYWAPPATARPGAGATQRIEAMERARSTPVAPPEPAQAPGAKPPATAR